MTIDGSTVARGDEAGVEPTTEGHRLQPRRVDDGLRISLDLRGRVDLEMIWSKA
ncbi:hypothetical protein ACFORO_32900 [Amycolatopsis halotolerans]|uniref:Uncharacterized protein n=1 Tax=Amycolatopsis halotolerans TaxID=330083 RepID=A0ABV7QT22_9PSEU